MISEGKSVPKFELNDADGNVFSSTDLRGKKYVIYFYPKDFTPGCTIEADEFSKDYKKFQKVELTQIDDDIQITLINDETKKEKKYDQNSK